MNSLIKHILSLSFFLTLSISYRTEWSKTKYVLKGCITSKSIYPPIHFVK